MTVPNGRSVTAIITYGAERLGVIGPFNVESPWWADVEPVAQHLRDELGGNVVVLRLVDVDGGTPPREGHVTYHVEALDRPQHLPPPADAHAGIDVRDPHRAAWATASGVRATLAWAESEAKAGGRLVAADRQHADGSVERTVEQVKTWNLSGLFRIPIGDGDPLWLKVTPPFAAHEPSVMNCIAAVDADLVPVVIAADSRNRRVLFEHVPGADCWDASPELIRATVDRWVSAQAAIAERPLPAVPDRRPTHLIAGLARLLDGEAGAQLTDDEMIAARDLQRRLPGLIDELAACGLPETLVHGDFHPGNWRSDGTRTVLVDFADAFIGHPAFDGERLREFVGADREQPVIDAWCAAWAERAPGSDPKGALRVARPLQALSGAILYQTFLDNIEASERRYHELDPPAGIRDAIEAAHRATAPA